MIYSTKAFIVGAIGDIGLQIIAQQRGDIAGLKTYFKQHGSTESVFIASGLMWGSARIYELTGLPLNPIYLGIYGGILDLGFRYGNIMPSLDNYYKTMSVEKSMLWGAIPMIIPLMFLN